MPSASSAVHLYELADARTILDEWLAEADGELTPELEALLNQLDGTIEEKVERVALFIRERTAQALAIRHERDRLDAAMRREDRAAESLKRYLHRHMESLGKGRVNGVLVTVAIQRNAIPTVTTPLSADELWAIPEAQPYMRREEKTIYHLDRDALLAAWRGGAPMPAGITVALGSHIRIR